jgi:hypothetical protein
MPSRRATLGILLLWLGALGWMVYRAHRESGEPPRLTIDMLAEVGAENTVWEGFRDGGRVASVRTEVGRVLRRPLELRCHYSLDNFLYRGLTVKSLSSTYGVTSRGVLRELSARVTLTLPSGKDSETDITGSLEAGRFTPLLQHGGVGHPQTAVEVASRGQVLNVLHPLHKMAGLYAGRSWRVPLLDPLAVAAAAPAGLTMRTAAARVEAADLEWEGKPVPCWRVDYREDDGAVALRVWVRILDDLVLQHEAHSGGATLVLVRKPNS